MTTQLFKKPIPIEELFILLDKICLKNEKYYIFNFDAFKKGLYIGDIETFITYCTSYYHVSKRKYLEKKLTYKSFTTILRQICNLNKIKYTSETKYDKSTYNIVYYIFYT